MATLSLLKRLEAKLAAASAATPKGESFWATLAQLAADECEKVIVVDQKPLPSQAFAALRRERETGWIVFARAAAMSDLATPATAYFEDGGAGDVYLVEIKRVYGLAP